MVSNIVYFQGIVSKLEIPVRDNTITHKLKRHRSGSRGPSVKTSSSHHSLNAIYAQPASSTVSLPMGYFQLKAAVQSQVEMCSSSVHLR